MAQEIWKEGHVGRRESRGWGWRLFVLRIMWFPTSPGDREGEPWGSVEAEAV